MYTKAGLNVTESCTVQVVLQPIYHAFVVWDSSLHLLATLASTTDEAWYWPYVLHSGSFCIADLQVEITVVTAHCLHVREQCSSWNVTVDKAYVHHMRILHHEYRDVRVSQSVIELTVVLESFTQMCRVTILPFRLWSLVTWMSNSSEFPYSIERRGPNLRQLSTQTMVAYQHHWNIPEMFWNQVKGIY